MSSLALSSSPATATAVTVPRTSDSGAFIPQTLLSPVYLFEEGTIVVARPWSELCAHIRHLQVPKWQLISRLMEALFQCSFYDHVMLLRPEAIYHSLKGRVEVVKSTGIMPDPRASVLPPLVYFTDEDLRLFKEQFPFLLENALYLRSKHSPSASSGGHPFIEVPLSGSATVSIPDFSNYSEITAETVRSYYLKAWGIKVTDKESGNKISDLVQSPSLVSREPTKLFYFNPVSGTQ